MTVAAHRESVGLAFPRTPGDQVMVYLAVDTSSHSPSTHRSIGIDEG